MRTPVILVSTAVVLVGSASARPQSHRSVNQVMPSRQVHLDFHTSEHIPDVGTRFEKAQFQDALKSARLTGFWRLMRLLPRRASL